MLDWICAVAQAPRYGDTPMCLVHRGAEEALELSYRVVAKRRVPGPQFLV